MPVVHIYVPEGWIGPARKKVMAEKVTDAVVEAEGVPATREMTYVLIHEVADGGWSFKGRVYDNEVLAPRRPADLPEGA